MMKQWAGLLLSFLVSTAWAEGPLVVTSILPFYHIAQAVVGKQGQVVLLVPQGASPHAYALKPSQYKAITDADVVIWVGPVLETYLEDALAHVAANKQMILMNDHAMIRYDLRGREQGDHASMDPHLWLDPLNAIRIATQLEKRLSALDPDNKKKYRHQTDVFVKTISALNTAISKQMMPFQSVPFVTYHDGFQYFEKRYGLTRLDSISNNPHVPLSATRWIEIGVLLKSEHIHCIFNEPQHHTDMLTKLASDNGAQVGILDPIGAEFPGGTEGYAALLTGIADSLAGCLGKYSNVSMRQSQ